MFDVLKARIIAVSTVELQVPIQDEEEDAPERQNGKENVNENTIDLQAAVPRQLQEECFLEPNPLSRSAVSSPLKTRLVLWRGLEFESGMPEMPVFTETTTTMNRLYRHRHVEVDDPCLDEPNPARICRVYSEVAKLTIATYATLANEMRLAQELQLGRRNYAGTASGGMRCSLTGGRHQHPLECQA